MLLRAFAVFVLAAAIRGVCDDVADTWRGRGGLWMFCALAPRAVGGSAYLAGVTLACACLALAILAVVGRVLCATLGHLLG